MKSSSYIARLNRNSDRPHLQNWLDDLVWAPGKAIWDAPLKVLDQGDPKGEQLLSTQLQPLFDEVSKELILVSAYFVPASAGLDYLTGSVPTAACACAC